MAPKKGELMEDSFPIVVAPEIWGLHISIDDNGEVICGACAYALLREIDCSVLHLLYTVQQHVKEAHNESR